MAKSNKVLIILLLLAICAGVYFLMNSDFLNKNSEKKQQDLANGTVQSQKAAMDETSTVSSTIPTESATSQENTYQIVRTEDIIIEYNTPEYDIKAAMFEDESKAVYLRFDYYLDGESRTVTLDSLVVPEIMDIFINRDANSDNIQGYRINSACLDTKLAKLYMTINGKGFNDMVEMSFYVFNLDDGTIKKIFTNTGKYGKMTFNKDYGFIAYSFDDPPESSILQETTLLEVVDCATDTMLVKNSRTADGERIGPNIEPKTIFDFTFISWITEDVVKLKQKTVLKDKNGKLNENDVLYDIKRNLFVNADGSAAKAESQTQEDIPAHSAESGALKTLKAFYTCLSGEKEYPKAMALLDDKFTLKMEILKSFGVEELLKSDIDVQSATGFSDILKSSSIESIVKEQEKEGAVTISYYQNMNAGSGSQIRMAMAAVIKKAGKGWKIVSLQDADMTKPPFAE